MRKRRKKRKPKIDKILILVEGKSDKIFIEGLLKELDIKRFFDVKDLSKKRGGTYILNKRKVDSKIKSAIEDGYSKVFIVIDLKTQDASTAQYFDCYPKLRDFYLREILSDQYSGYVKVIVAVKELECWELLAGKQLNTANINDCLKELRKCLDWDWEPDKVELAQYFVKKIPIIINNKHLNTSFEYFLECLQNSLPE